MHDGIGQGLAGVGIFLNELTGCEKAGRGHGTAKHLSGALERARVCNDFDIAFLLEHGHRGVGIADGVNLAGA